MTMFSIDSAPDPATSERDALRSDLSNSIGVMIGRAQLLERQVLRSSALMSPHRDQLLHSLGDVLAEVRRIAAQIEDVVATHTSHLSMADALNPTMPDGMRLAFGDGIIMSIRPADIEPSAHHGTEQIGPYAEPA
jgi:hypothetical protein